jgi:hypothetical protein
MSRSKNSLARWWGFALVVAVLAALPSSEVPAAILFVLSGLSLVWVLFLAPARCGADTRDHKPCRNNCSGLLRACHIREHRRQKFEMMFSKSRWQQLKDLWSSPREVIATVSGLIAIVGAVVAIMRWIAVATSGA